MPKPADVVLVTELEFRKAEAVFRGAQCAIFEPAPADENALARRVRERGARVAVVGVSPYAGPLYEALGPVGGLIVRFGVGHDNIDKGKARHHGVIVANTPGVLDSSVAEHAVWLMGCLARRITRAETGFRNGGFAGETGVELGGRTLGILGFGRIGRRVAAIAHFGFGMHVLAADRRTAAEIEAVERRPIDDILAETGTGEYSADIEAVFRAADILSVHLPVTPDTLHFLDGRRLSWLKSSAMVINTARGAIIDERALYDALVAGRLGGAALDVFEKEPYEPSDPGRDLRQLVNVVLTPHIGSNTCEANERMGAACVENALRFLTGHLDEITSVG